MEENGYATVNVVPPKEYYTPATLAAALAAALTAASPSGATYTVTWDANTGFYTISNSTITFSLPWTTDAAAYPNNYMYSVLGFSWANPSTGGPDPDTPYAMSQTSTGTGVLGSAYYYLKINPIASTYKSTNNIGGVFACVPVTGNAYDRIFWTNNLSYDQYQTFRTKGENYRAFQIQLTHSDGTIVDLNGANIEMILSFESFPNIDPAPKPDFTRYS